MIIAPSSEAHLSSKADHLKAKFYPESRLGGFSHVDGTVAMYTQIASILRPDSVVLEFGAGRGANIDADHSAYRRELQTFRGRCARIVGCDVDPVVLENPYLEEATVFEPGQPLPYADETFDLIVSSWVFEHVGNAQETADELLRILKPGGVICASTPNKFGYVALAARFTGSGSHVRLLSKIQPERLAKDIFPTHYRMNSTSALKKLFGHAADVMVFRTSADPSYHFNNKLLYGAFKLFHKIMPDVIATTLYVFIRKHKITA